MTIAVDLGRKATKQQTNKQSVLVCCCANNDPCYENNSLDNCKYLYKFGAIWEECEKSFHFQLHNLQEMDTKP